MVTRAELLLQGCLSLYAFQAEAGSKRSKTSFTLPPNCVSAMSQQTLRCRGASC